MDGLSIDNILTGDEIENLFVDNDTQDPAPDNAGTEETETPDNGGENKKTTEVNVDSLFTEKPESVGSGDTKEQEDTTTDKGDTSPKFYSSIAKAFAEEGIFPDLDEEDISKIETPEDFRDLINKQIRAGLDEQQKRINDALSAGVEPDIIKQYEGTLHYLDTITDTDLTAEDNEGELLRKKLIYQDFINRGYSQERAQREVQKSLSGGTDIDDAREALKGNKDFFYSKYNDILEDAKREEQIAVEHQKEQAKKLKDSILTEKKAFGDLEVDKNTRQRAYDAITKPVYKDPNTGESYTALQKYERENRLEFMKNLGLIYTLTDGFKNLDGLVKGKVRREVKKGFRELENTLNNTARTSDGTLNYASGVDSESFIGKGWTIDA